MNSMNISSDETLKTAVLEELLWEPSVTAADIGVTARAGVITLTGNIRSFAEKLAAERAAQRVKGVKAVAEEIEVRLPFDSKRTDDEIAAAAISQLTWDSMVPKDAVKIKVEQGVVTLSGEVEHYFQREAAYDDVHRLAGVTRVANLVTIMVQPSAANITDDIQHALNRSWLFDPELVHVTASGGKVTLTGAVHSPYDRRVAGMTAWAAHGATSVANEITIN